MAIEIPRFENEDQEAQWWYDHRDEVGADLVAASCEGRLGEGTLGRQARRAAQEGSQTFAGDAAERTREQLSR